MIDARKTAVVVALLFVVATVASVLAAALLGPVLGEADYLDVVSQNANTMVVIVLSMFIAAAPSLASRSRFSPSSSYMMRH